MGTSIAKQMAGSLSLLAIFSLFLDVAHSADSIALKVSQALGSTTALVKNQAKRPVDNQSLLSKVTLFRGVSVGDGTSKGLNSNPGKIEIEESNENSRSMVRAIYGGLQFSLKENLSLVYAPGRLSGNTLNSESQGLYLLANRGGLANWFVGVESRSYNSSTESRRSANSAQFGVIMELD
jgi:hypothetical protein